MIRCPKCFGSGYRVSGIIKSGVSRMSVSCLDMKCGFSMNIEKPIGAPMDFLEALK